MWITEEDRRWIAENLVLGNSPESMLDAMVHAGRDEAGARVAIMAAGTNPLIEGARRATERLERRLKKYEWLLRTSRQLSSAANASREVPEVSEINPEEFYRRFYFLNSPVVLTGCVSHWKAMETWRPARLSRRFGSQIVEVQSGRARVSDYERRAEQCARPMAFSDFIEAIATTRFLC